LILTRNGTGPEITTTSNTHTAIKNNERRRLLEKSSGKVDRNHNLANQRLIFSGCSNQMFTNDNTNFLKLVELTPRFNP
jgi:hypothetical protein